MDGVIDTAGGEKGQEVLSILLGELNQETEQSLEGVQGILVKGGIFLQKVGYILIY